MSEFIISLASNLIDDARTQVERNWGEDPEKKLGTRLYNGQVAMHALLALTGYAKVTERLTDEEFRQLVIAVWDELRKETT